MKKPSPALDLFQDLLALALFLGTAGPAAWATVEIGALLGAERAWLWPALFLVFLAAWSAACGIVFWALLAWNLEEGTFDLGGNRASIVWYLEFALRRFISYDPFGRFIHGFKFLRTIRYLAFGTYVPYTANFSADIEIQSPYFFRIGPRSMIGSHAVVSARMIDHGSLVYRKIEIGEDVQISLFASIGPGVKIGDRTVIGARFDAYPLARIGKDCVIEEGVRVEPGARIGDGARIGRHAVISERARVAPGEVVPAFGRV